ncbi:thiamine pyrophosphate-binding protein [Halobacteria archaeon AArc-curdl1]|uniref:Thiamine pyrophosphate-binding protein n=1 Tax=Natronosalvus hydrolyticus TaxID=2979988 RepID=A0AAP2ZCB0_9EURY|nr:thiamine pyrophosphate-binding protein [Halobacteria archaeon AArc-curdl1]
MTDSERTDEQTTQPADNEAATDTEATADRVVDTLEALDVEFVFGYPGGRIIEVFETIGHRETDISVVRPRDEREASVMAEAYGRMTGSPAVLAGQGPWIGSLGTIGQMEARLGSSPMVVLTEASERGDYSTLAPYQQARGDYGGLSLPKILDGVTKEWWFPRTPNETVRSVQLAFKHATAGRSGPCAVIFDGSAITDDLENGQTPGLWDDKRQVQNWRSRPTDADLEAAVDALEAAERPVILAGNGVHSSAGAHDGTARDGAGSDNNSAGDERQTGSTTENAYDLLVDVAETFDAAVATSYLGKSTIPETHERAAGVIGSFGHEGANQVVSEADVLLVVGCRLNPMDTNWQAASFIRPDEQTIIHADIDSRNAGWVYPADVGLIGDAGETLAALLENAENREIAAFTADGTSTATKENGESWALERAATARQDFQSSLDETDPSDEGLIKPQQVCKAIEAVVEEDTVVTADSGNNRFWLLNYLQVPTTGSYYGSGGVGAMGWAAPAAVTAALLGKDAICVAGDGGFTMTMTALETAVDCGVAPTFVILNDRSLGMVRQMDDSIPGTTFHDTDFVAIARAMGGDGVRITESDGLERTIAEATSADVPTVVDVRIDPDEEMADQLSSSFYDEVGGLHE